jgi:hypothetical protein
MAAATTRGDGTMEKKFPSDMFLLLRAFVKQREVRRCRVTRSESACIKTHVASAYGLSA